MTTKKPKSRKRANPVKPLKLWAGVVEGKIYLYEIDDQFGGSNLRYSPALFTTRRRPFKNAVLLLVNPLGDIIGTRMEPSTYVSEHQDLVGRVKNMPTLEIEWLSDENT